MYVNCAVQRRAASSPGAMNVFDRAAKRLQRNRAALDEEADTYDYLRNEVRKRQARQAQCLSPPSFQVASHIIDRVCDISRFFPLTLDVGCGRGHIAKVTTSDITERVVQCDMAENALVRLDWTHSRDNKR